LKTKSRSETADREEAMRKARERQQELLNDRSKIAAEEMKKKKLQEKERKNNAAPKVKEETGSGHRLGGSGYNPLQPSTGMSGGYRYVICAVVS